MTISFGVAILTLVALGSLIIGLVIGSTWRNVRLTRYIPREKILMHGHNIIRGEYRACFRHGILKSLEPIEGTASEETDEERIHGRLIPPPLIKGVHV